MQKKNAQRPTLNVKDSKHACCGRQRESLDDGLKLDFSCRASLARRAVISLPLGEGRVRGQFELF